LPVRYKASPEILQIIITSTITVVTTVVHRLWAAPPSVRIDVWIGNMRIAGSKSDATLWETQAPRNADSCHATMGRIANRALRSAPFWGRNLITLTGRYP
ncbi:target of rapamycin (TOR) kinase 1, partial [Trypanosoma cruzi]